MYECLLKNTKEEFLCLPYLKKMLPEIWARTILLPPFVKAVLRLIVLLWILLAQASLESLIGRRMRKQLGGMSGDVSGYMIVTGELTGILLLALVGGAIAL